MGTLTLLLMLSPAEGKGGKEKGLRLQRVLAVWACLPGGHPDIAAGAISCRGQRREGHATAHKLLRLQGHLRCVFAHQKVGTLQQQSEKENGMSGREHIPR